MQSEFQHLVSDTLAFLKQEGHPLEKKKPSPKAPKPQEVKKSVSSPPSLLLDKIETHLPQMRLIKELPKNKQVAIIVHQMEELPFLKKLAKAIEAKLCPVKLLKGESLSPSRSLEAFTLILSSKEIPSTPTFLLAPFSTYESDPEEKKKLWSQLCQHLSPKSS
jgi:hypothetical protein